MEKPANKLSEAEVEERVRTQGALLRPADKEKFAAWLRTLDSTEKGEEEQETE
jgi:hypothetical protein